MPAHFYFVKSIKGFLIYHAFLGIFLNSVTNCNWHSIFFFLVFTQHRDYFGEFERSLNVFDKWKAKLENFFSSTKLNRSTNLKAHERHMNGHVKEIFLLWKWFFLSISNLNVWRIINNQIVFSSINKFRENVTILTYFWWKNWHLSNI